MEIKWRPMNDKVVLKRGDYVRRVSSTDISVSWTWSGNEKILKELETLLWFDNVVKHVDDKTTFSIVGRQCSSMTVFKYCPKEDCPNIALVCSLSKKNQGEKKLFYFWDDIFFTVNDIIYDRTLGEIYRVESIITPTENRFLLAYYIQIQEEFPYIKNFSVMEDKTLEEMMLEIARLQNKVEHLERLIYNQEG